MFHVVQWETALPEPVVPSAVVFLFVRQPPFSVFLSFYVGELAAFCWPMIFLGEITIQGNLQDTPTHPYLVHFTMMG